MHDDTLREARRTIQAAARQIAVRDGETDWFYRAQQVANIFYGTQVVPMRVMDAVDMLQIENWEEAQRLSTVLREADLEAYAFTRELARMSDVWVSAVHELVFRRRKGAQSRAHALAELYRIREDRIQHRIRQATRRLETGLIAWLLAWTPPWDAQHPVDAQLRWEAKRQAPFHVEDQLVGDGLAASEDYIHAGLCAGLTLFSFSGPPLAKKTRQALDELGVPMDLEHAAFSHRPMRFGFYPREWGTPPAPRLGPTELRLSTPDF